MGGPGYENTPINNEPIQPTEPHVETPASQREKVTEIEFLQYFYFHCTDEEPKLSIVAQFKQETGKELPEGYQ